EEPTPLAVQSYLSGLREQVKPVSAHKHFRTLKTFLNWCLETGLLNEHPMRGLHMKMPKPCPGCPRMTTCGSCSRRALILSRGAETERLLPSWRTAVCGYQSRFTCGSRTSTSPPARLPCA